MICSMILLYSYNTCIYTRLLLAIVLVFENDLNNYLSVWQLDSCFNKNNINILLLIYS